MFQRNTPLPPQGPRTHADLYSLAASIKL
jgi:hypothetical protein